MTGVIHAHITETSMDYRMRSPLFLCQTIYPSVITLLTENIIHMACTYKRMEQLNSKKAIWFIKEGYQIWKNNHSFGRKMNQTNRQRKVSGTIKRNTGWNIWFHNTTLIHHHSTCLLLWWIYRTSRFPRIPVLHRNRARRWRYLKSNIFHDQSKQQTRHRKK